MPGIGVGVAVGLMGSAASPLNNTIWVADATPDNATRTGFADDTQLPDFGVYAAPEQSDAISTSLSLTQSGTTLSGTYTDVQGITCSVSGTYTPSTGAVSLSGTGSDWAVSASLTYAGGILTGTITVARSAGGASSEDRDWAGVEGAAVVPTSAYYVDSRDGNDTTGDGSASAPYATISKAVTAGWGAEGTTLRLARGSRFREMAYSANDNVTVEYYGVGPRPVPDGADLVTSWSKTGGLTNVYETSFTPEFDHATGDATYVPLENGVAMIRVADTATCDATAGSCVVPEPDGSTTYTIYIHASDSGDPTSNGSVYEIPSRENGVWLSGDGCTVRGVMGRGSAGSNGGVRNTGAGSTTDDCWAVWCPYHNFLYSAGATFTRNVALGSPLHWSGGSSDGGVHVVGYVSDGGGTATATVTDIAVIQHSRADLANELAAFLTHVSPGNDPWGTITYDRIYASGIEKGISGGAATNTTLLDMDRLLLKDFTGYAISNCAITLTRSRILAHVNGYNGFLINTQADLALSISQSVFTCGATYASQMLNLYGGGTTIDRTLFWSASTNDAAVGDETADALVTSHTRNCYKGTRFSLNEATTAGISNNGSDYNQFYGYVILRRNLPDGAMNFATWVSTYAADGLDQNSADTQPTWTDDSGDTPTFSAKTDGYDSGPTHTFDFETDQPAGYAAATFAALIWS